MNNNTSIAFEDASQTARASVDTPEYVAMEEGVKTSSRRERYKAEFLELVYELITYAKYKNWKKKFLTVILCVCSFLVFCDLIFFGNIVSWLHSFVLWMKDHIVEGVFSFIGLFVITTLVFIPPSILTFACGYIFADVCGLLPGIIAATLVCFIGSVLGAIIAFFRARYMMRDLIQLFARRYTIIRAADRAIKRNGFRVMLLLRLCPIIPFNGLNYIGGITAVHWEAFTFSLVGILPLQILTVTMGATSQTLLSKNDEWQLFHIILVCSGMAFLIIAVAITGYFAKKELGKELSEATELQERSDAKITSVSSPDDDAALSVRDEGEEVDYLVGVDDEEWFWMFA